MLEPSAGTPTLPLDIAQRDDHGPQPGTNAHTATNALIHEQQLKADAAIAELLQNRLDANLAASEAQLVSQDIHSYRAHGPAPEAFDDTPYHYLGSQPPTGAVCIINDAYISPAGPAPHSSPVAAGQVTCSADTYGHAGRPWLPRVDVHTEEHWDARENPPQARAWVAQRPSIQTPGRSFGTWSLAGRLSAGWARTSKSNLTGRTTMPPAKPTRIPFASCTRTGYTPTTDALHAKALHI